MDIIRMTPQDLARFERVQSEESDCAIIRRGQERASGEGHAKSDPCQFTPRMNFVRPLVGFQMVKFPSPVMQRISPLGAKSARLMLRSRDETFPPWYTPERNSLVTEGHGKMMPSGVQFHMMDIGAGMNLTQQSFICDIMDLDGAILAAHHREGTVAIERDVCYCTGDIESSDLSETARLDVPARNATGGGRAD
jgi:hypothetical protein